LADAHSKVATARNALTYAKNDLQRVKSDNEKAMSEYNRCKDEKMKLLEIEKEKDIAQLDAHIPENTQKVGIQKDLSKTYLMYGAVAIGVVSLGFFGLYMITKK
jgi:hypothetical protein